MDLRAIIDMVWNLRYWIVLSVFVALALGAVYLYRATKTYQANMLVMITTDKNAGMQASAELSFLSDMTGMKASNSLDNEKVIIASTPVLRNVVKEMDLNIHYYVRHHFATRETAAQDVKASFIPLPTVNENDLPMFEIFYDIPSADQIHLTVSMYDKEVKDMVDVKDTTVHFNKNKIGRAHV